ncbi:hypothetical protein FLI78_14390 [Pseudomonas aeruginosa]|nr:hypothetical protein FLI78_14390 [Pseudomonas aeruginosa]
MHGGGPRSSGNGSANARPGSLAEPQTSTGKCLIGVLKKTVTDLSARLCAAPFQPPGGRSPIRDSACHPRQRRCTLAPTREPDAAGEKTAAAEQ